MFKPLKPYRPLAQNRKFVRLFLGRLTTNAGDSLYYVATTWLVYEMTGSSLYTGLTSALLFLPSAVQFLFGPLVDRWSLRSILVRTQLAQAALLLVILAAAAVGSLTTWLLVGVVVVAGFLNQFVYPAEGSALPQIVDDKELADANVLFAFAYQGVDAAFSAIGGVLVALIGAIALYAVDSVTFLAAAALYAGVRVPQGDNADAVDGEDEEEDAADAEADDESIESAVRQYVTELRNGIEYTWGTVLVEFLGVAVLANLANGATLAVLPAFASQFGGADLYGLLSGALSAGLLVGSLSTSFVKRYPLGRLSFVGLAVSAVTWFGAVMLSDPIATPALFVLAWVPIGAYNVLLWTVIQGMTEEKFLGRINSLASTVSYATLPVGSLLGGILTEWMSPSDVLLLVTAGLLLASILWVVHPKLRAFPAVDEADPARYGF
jgi:MFS family permease